MATEPEFSVVIATRNRRDLLARAIKSIPSATAEIIVVDDGSTDDTAGFVRQAFPEARVIRVAHGGPGPARNRGIEEARGRWVIVLDDDDELKPDALQTIGHRLGEFADRDRFPAFMFRHGNGRLRAPFRILATEQFCNGDLGGDFLPVWNREVARAAGCRYPDSRIGAEGLMWLELTERYGVPTWADCVGIVHTDAADRLTGVAAQLRHAAEHARLQDRYVEFLRRQPPTRLTRGLLARRLLAAGFYYLLAGERREALARLKHLVRYNALFALVLAPLCTVPRAVLVRLLRLYRGKGHDRVSVR